MTRAHRTLHAWTWMILGPLILAGMVVALIRRPPAFGEPVSASEAPAAGTSNVNAAVSSNEGAP